MTIGGARILDRALGALYGLAIGDALGMPTQLMSQARVRIAFPPTPLAPLVDAVAATSRATHNTGIAIAGAAAVAAAISVGIADEPWRTAVDVAIGAAELGAGKGHWVAGADVASRISWAVGLVDGLPEAAAARAITQLVGTSLATQEAVPAAFAVLAATQGNPWRAALPAAHLGGDADTIGAMAGAIGGACVGFSALPP